MCLNETKKTLSYCIKNKKKSQHYLNKSTGINIKRKKLIGTLLFQAIDPN